MSAVYIKAIAGQTYTNQNGDTYLCLKSGSGPKPGPDMKATMERQPDGWTLVAHGILQYEDGLIEWNFSTDGHWPGGTPKNWMY